MDDQEIDKDWKINSCILCCLKVLDSTLDLQFRTKSSFFHIITYLEVILSHYDQIWSSILGHMGVLGTGASLKKDNEDSQRMGPMGEVLGTHDDGQEVDSGQLLDVHHQH